MQFESFKFEIKENIAYLTMCLPPKNTMNMQFYEDIYDIAHEIKDLSHIRGLIISGEGRHFSSGADTEELFSVFRKNEYTIPSKILKNSKAFHYISELPFPVIACIKGVCLGAATELALVSHFRIATSSALIGLPETEFGILPGLGGIYNTTKCMGSAKTLKFVLTGTPLSADEAFENGLIDKIVPKHELEESALTIINSIKGVYKKEFKNVYLNQRTYQ